MGLLDYRNFLNMPMLNEAFGVMPGNWQIFRQNRSELKNGVFDYAALLTLPKYAANGEPVLTELLQLIDFIPRLSSDARSISGPSEDLVAAAYDGNPTNIEGAPDSIFYDVEIGSTTFLSVKSSNQSTPLGVISYSPIKIPQILSLLFHEGRQAVTQNDYDSFLERIKNNDKPSLGSKSYGIATVHNKGTNVYITRTNDLSAEDIWTNFNKNFDKLSKIAANVKKPNLDSGSDLALLGWAFNKSTEIEIIGQPMGEIQKLADERKIILQGVAKLPNPDLRQIAKDYNIPTS